MTARLASAFLARCRIAHRSSVLFLADLSGLTVVAHRKAPVAIGRTINMIVELPLEKVVP